MNRRKRQGAPHKTRGGRVVSFWIGIDEDKILKAWSAYRGHRSISQTIRELIGELTDRFGKENDECD